MFYFMDIFSYIFLRASRWCLLLLWAILPLCVSAWAAQNAPVPRIKPPSPEPVYLDKADHATLTQYFHALDRRRWTRATHIRATLHNTLAKDIAEWAYYHAYPDTVSFPHVAAFLTRRPDWPSSSTIQLKAERSMTPHADNNKILAFFTGRPPISGQGKLILGLTKIEEGDIVAGTALIRAAWIDHDWSAREETRFVARHGTYLRAQDHVAKADRQLFEIKATATKRIISYLPTAEKRKAETRIAFILRQAKGAALYRALPESARQDSGVLHAATRYHRRMAVQEQAIDYAHKATDRADELRQPKRWWIEKKLLLRWALKNAHFEDAYRLAATSGLHQGQDFADAAFSAGWVALRFLNDPARAQPHFTRLSESVRSPVSRARAQYWLGRTLEAQQKPTEARQHYLAAAAHPMTYYGQLAQEKLIPSISHFFPPQIQPTMQERRIFNTYPHVSAMRILAEIGRDDAYNAFARKLDDQLKSTGEYAAYEELVAEEGKFFLSVRAGKMAVRNNVATPHIAYPLVPVPDEARHYMEVPLILGLARQESEFNARARSPANARGMMQLLPTTAQLTAKKIEIPYQQTALTENPTYNLTLGAAHLHHLAEQFNGSYVLILCAYNAGPRRTEEWIATYGDPRHPTVDPVDWVELIPFTETRNYVMRVLENVQIYRARLTGGPIAGRLSADLVRGGNTPSAIGLPAAAASLTTP